MREQGVIESHPIRVDQYLDAEKRFPEQIGPVEIKWDRANLVAKGVWSSGRVRQSQDTVTGAQQPLGDVTSRISECARDCGLHGDGLIKPKAFPGTRSFLTDVYPQGNRACLE